MHCLERSTLNCTISFERLHTTTGCSSADGCPSLSPSLSLSLSLCFLQTSMSSHTWTLQTPLQFDQDTTWLWLHRSPGCFIALCNIVHHSSAGICRVFFWFTRRETGESHTQDLGVGVSCNLISTFKSWLRWCQMSPYTQILCVSLSPVSLQVNQKNTANTSKKGCTTLHNAIKHPGDRCNRLQLPGTHHATVLSFVTVSQWRMLWPTVLKSLQQWGAPLTLATAREHDMPSNSAAKEYTGSCPKPNPK